jgi:hypothetical protein
MEPDTTLSNKARVSVLTNENDDENDTQETKRLSANDVINNNNIDKNSSSTSNKRCINSSSEGACDGDNDEEIKKKKAKSDKEEEIRRLVQDELSSTDKYSVATVLGKLANLCYNHPNAEEHRRLIGKFDGGMIVLRFVMKHNADNAKIQSRGCRFLMNWMLFNESGKETVCRLGGIEVILKAMQSFPDSSLQRYAIGALKNVAFYPFKKERVQRIVDGGAIPAIVTAMKSHPDEVVLQQRACEALSILCEVEEYRALVRNAGGFVSAAEALDRHGDADDKVNKHASKVLELLLKLMKK